MEAVPRLSIPSSSAPSLDASMQSNQQARVEFKKIKSEGIAHLFPTLKDLQVEGKVGDNPSVQETVEELRSRGQRVETFEVEWRGKTPEELTEALAPMVAHYRMQALLIRERARRRVIENEQLTMRSNLHVAYQYKTPLKHKLMAHWTKSILQRHMQANEDVHGGVESQEQSMHMSMSGSDNSFRFPGSSTQEGRPHKRPPQPAPPMLSSSRRGSLQSNVTNRLNDSTATEPTTHQGPDAAAVHHLDLNDVHESTARFEQTLTMLLDSTHTGGRGGRRPRGPPQSSHGRAGRGAAYPPLNFPAGGGGATAKPSKGPQTVAAAFQSAIKEEKRTE